MNFKMNMENDVKEMEEKHIMKVFARRRLVHWAIMLGAVVIVILIWYIRLTTNGWYVWLLGGVAIAGLVVSYINWKCPSCKKYLGRSYNPAKCPNCGVKLHN